jgi:glycosyltransferase involved in cell wall biosynthesis
VQRFIFVKNKYGGKILISIIIPAHQEAESIQRCLNSVIDQSITKSAPNRIEIIVAANACSDATVEKACEMEDFAFERGVDLKVIDDPIGGKTRALNRGDQIARGEIRIYLDADVVCAPTLLEELVAALKDPVPLYASGTVTIPPSRSWVSRCYARFWTKLPFVASDVAGYGLYAVNMAGRRRWSEFPDVHSDDKFVRLLFKSTERRRVAASYSWPIPDGIWNLLQVRRRWSRGNAQLRAAFPALHSDPYSGSALQYAQAAASRPVSALIFAIVYGGGALLARGDGLSSEISWRRAR